MNASHTASYRVTLRIYEKSEADLPVVVCIKQHQNVCGGEKGIGNSLQYDTDNELTFQKITQRTYRANVYTH